MNEIQKAYIGFYRAQILLREKAGELWIVMTKEEREQVVNECQRIAKAEKDKAEKD